MVTRLESGQVRIDSAGAVPMQRIDVPTVDFMVAARERARGATTLADILSRMSQSVFGVAGAMVQEEALRFAAGNPLTDEQLQLAKDGMPSAIPGVGKYSSDFTIYGKALQKARSLELSARFEVEGRNELVKMLVDMQAGKKVNSQDINKKIGSIIDGHTKSLAQVDGDAAIKYRATMATHGNTVLNSAYEIEQKRNKEQQVALFASGFNNSMKLLEADVSRGFWIDENGRQRTIDDLIKVTEFNIINQSLLLGDAGIQKEYGEKFRIALRNAKINAVGKHLINKFLSDPVDTLNKLKTRKIGEMSAVLDDLYNNDLDAYNKVVANYITATNQVEEQTRRERDEKLRKDKAEAINLLEQIFPIKDPNNPERKNLVKRVMALTPESLPIGIVKELLEPKEEGDGNPSAEYYALKKIYKNEIRNEDEIDRIPGLNFKQKITVLKAFRSENKASERDYDSALNKLSDIPEDPSGVFVLDKKSDEWKKKQRLKAEGEQIKAEAAIDGRTITNAQVIKQLEENVIKRQNTAEAKAAKDALDYFVLDKSGRAKPDRDWITGPINRQTLPALKQKAEATKDPGDRTRRMRQIQEIERLLKISEGM